MPIYTADLVYNHMPKTGGTTMSHILKTSMGGRKVGKMHTPASDLARFEDPGSRLVFGTIRNPWAWYWSWYQHCVRANKHKGTHLKTYGQGQSDFKSVLHGATHTWEVQPPKRPGVIWGWDGMNDRPAFQAAHVGLYTWGLWNMYGPGGEWLVQAFIDTDQMVQGLADLTGKTAVEYHLNQGDYGMDPADQYDAEMVEWVAQADPAIVAMMGYEPFKAASVTHILLGD